MYRSLYYAKDLPEVQPNQLVDIGSTEDTINLVFAIGPTTNSTFFDDERDAADVNRGPCQYYLRQLISMPNNIFVY